MALTQDELTAQDAAIELYHNKAAVYDFVFLHFIGYGMAVRAFFRHSDILEPNIKVLDAGCGSGLVTKTLFQQAKQRAIEGIEWHGFDLSSTMLARFQTWIGTVGDPSITTQEANVLDLSRLPKNWCDYDVIVSSAMLEYVPRASLSNALKGLRQRLKPQGRMFLVITRRTKLTQWLVGHWWKSELYTPENILDAMAEAGFSSAEFHPFPGTMRPFTRWILVAEAAGQA